MRSLARTFPMVAPALVSQRLQTLLHTATWFLTIRQRAAGPQAYHAASGYTILRPPNRKILSVGLQACAFFATFVAPYAHRHTPAGRQGRVRQRVRSTLQLGLTPWTLSLFR